MNEQNTNAKKADRTVYATRDEGLAGKPEGGRKGLRLRPVTAPGGRVVYVWAADALTAVSFVARADGYAAGEPCDEKFVDPVAVAGALDSKQLAALLKAAKQREKAATTAASGAVADSEKVAEAETPNESNAA